MKGQQPCPTTFFPGQTGRPPALGAWALNQRARHYADRLTTEALHAWLTASGWTEQPAVPDGTVWANYGATVTVPAAGTPLAILEAVGQVAAAERRPTSDILGEMGPAAEVPLRGTRAQPGRAFHFMAPGRLRPGAMPAAGRLPLPARGRRRPSSHSPRAGQNASASASAMPAHPVPSVPLARTARSSATVRG